MVTKLDEKTTREVARILISESSHPEIHFKEKLTPKIESIAEVVTYLDQETIDVLERAKEIWSHAMKIRLKRQSRQSNARTGKQTPPRAPGRNSKSAVKRHGETKMNQFLN